MPKYDLGITLGYKESKKVPPLSELKKDTGRETSLSISNVAKQLNKIPKIITQQRPKLQGYRARLDATQKTGIPATQASTDTQSLKRAIQDLTKTITKTNKGLGTAKTNKGLGTGGASAGLGTAGRMPMGAGGSLGIGGVVKALGGIMGATIGGALGIGGVGKSLGGIMGAKIGGSLGIGGVGKSLGGIMGATIGVSVFAAVKALEVGRARLEALQSQGSTAGVGGVQSGRSGMSSGQMGEYVKERRMAAGKFEPDVSQQMVGPTYSQTSTKQFVKMSKDELAKNLADAKIRSAALKKQMGSVAAFMTPDRWQYPVGYAMEAIKKGGVYKTVTSSTQTSPSKMQGVSQYANTNPTAAMDYRRMYGLGGGDVAKTVGLMDVMGGGKGGEDSFQRMIQSTYTKKGGQVTGLETELPLVVREISSALEDAVRNGVNDSDIAPDMASEIAKYANATKESSARQGIQLQKSMGSVTEAASKGRWGGMKEWTTMKIAMKMVAEDPEVQKKLRESGYLRKEGEGEITAQEKVFAAQRVLETEKTKVNAQYRIGLLKSFGRGETRPEKMANIMMQAGGTDMLTDAMKGPGGLSTEMAVAERDLAKEKLASSLQKGQRLRDEAERGPSFFQKMIGVSRRDLYKKANEQEQISQGLRTEYESTAPTVAEAEQARQADVQAATTRGGDAYAAQDIQITKSNMLVFSGAAMRASEAAVKIDNAMIKVAGLVDKNMADTIVRVTEKLGALGAGLESLVTGTLDLFKKLNPNKVKNYIPGVAGAP